MNRRVSKRGAWVITGSYWVVMALITHSPPFLGKSDTPSPALALDKLGHLIGFALLAFFLRALIGWRVTLIVAVAAVYAVVDELTQPWVGRTADPKDWVADMLGVGVGLLAAILWQRVRRAPPADPAGQSASAVADAVHPQP
ncbi:MAG: VanZ family protein [Planctomycetota bacterium]